MASVSMVAVAREANVAVSTVSLALNHRDRVKPETRERIEAAMKRLGYQPGRRRPRGEKQSIALRAAFVYTLDSLIADGDTTMSNYCREVIAGMQESIAGTSSSLSIFRGAAHVDHDLIVNDQITANEFDGVVLFGADPRNGYMQRFQESGIPFITINHPSPHGRFSCVTLDYYGGACQAIEHLISLGHQRIAIAANDNPEKWLVKQFLDGSLDTIKRHDLQPALDDLRTDKKSNEQYCRDLIDAGATALFCGDHLAVKLIDGLAAVNVRVPEDFSVIGFDDRGIKPASGKILTTIGYDKRRMGRMAIRMMQQLVQGRSKTRWLAGAVSTHVVEGETTGEAPGK